MANVIVNRVNQNGLPCIKSTGVNLSDTRLTISFANHVNVSNYFQGLFLIYVTDVPAEAAEADDIPVYVATDGYVGSEKQLYTPQTTAVMADEVKAGVYLCFYDSTTDRVRVMM